MLDNNGVYVSKEEILGRVWAETFVEDGVLTQNVYTLRKALGPAPDGLSLIENRNRLGYRIAATVVKIDNAETANQEVSTAPGDQNPRRRWVMKASLALFAVLLMAAALVGWRFFLPQIASVFRAKIDTVKFVAATKTGDVSHAVLSPDGNFLAMIRGAHIYLKDLATSSEVKIDVPGIDGFSALAFSPDGKSIYFRNNKIFNTVAKVYRVSRFGGNAEFLMERSWGNIAVSPDGRRVATFNGLNAAGQLDLVIFNLESKEIEKSFSAALAPNSLCGNCRPSWAPDGRRILFTATTAASSNQFWLANIDTGTVEEVKMPRFRRFEQATWFPDGSGFLLSANDGGNYFHLWKVYYPVGDAQPLTNGLLSYGQMSISSDGRKIIALQTHAASNIFVADAADLANSMQITTGNQNHFGKTALNWIDENRLVMSVQDEKLPVDNLAVLNIGDGSQRMISNESRSPPRTPTSDGKFIYFNKVVDANMQIFQMKTDGTGVRQLTTENDCHRQSPRVTADGRFVFYSARAPGSNGVRRFDVVEGKEEIVFQNERITVGPFLELSSDGKYVTFFNINAERDADESLDKYNASMVIASVENPADYRTFPVSVIPPVRRFSPDGKFVDWILAATDGTEIVRGNGTEPNLTTIFRDPAGYIFNFAWSRSGRLAVSIGKLTRDAVLISTVE